MIHMQGTKKGREEGGIEQDRTPLEINDHLKIFGKDADEVNYNGVGPCPFCGSRHRHHHQ
jgi:hypothetical protein